MQLPHACLTMHCIPLVNRQHHPRAVCLSGRAWACPLLVMLTGLSYICIYVSYVVPHILNLSNLTHVMSTYSAMFYNGVAQHSSARVPESIRESTSAGASTRAHVSPPDDEHISESGSRVDSLLSSLFPDSSRESTENRSISNSSTKKHRVITSAWAKPA